MTKYVSGGGTERMNATSDLQLFQPTLFYLENNNSNQGISVATTKNCGGFVSVLVWFTTSPEQLRDTVTFWVLEKVFSSLNFAKILVFN